METRAKPGIGALAAALGSAAAVFAGDARAQGLPIHEWSHRSPVVLKAAPAGGLVEFPLTPEIFDASLGDLSDLRLVTSDGAEVGFVITFPEEGAVRTPIPVKLINRAYDPGKFSQVTADFSTKVLKNRIEVLTPGTNFRRRVRIEGSDNGNQWVVIRDGALVFRFEGAADSGATEKHGVDLPATNHRFLRVTVHNGSDDLERIDPVTVMAFQIERRRAETVHVPISKTLVSENAKERATEIALDLGARNLPLHELSLLFSDANFHRRVTVSGRNEEKSAVKIPTEAGGARSMSVDVPWKPLRHASLYRLAGAADEKEESLAINLRGTNYRHLLVRVENRDDPPLSFEGAAVTSALVRAAFQHKGGGEFFVYAGNPGARRPEYDLLRYAERLRKEGVTGAVLGPIEPNPARPPARDVPWSERHKWLLWAALALGAAVLAYVIGRQAGAAKGRPT